MWQSKINAWGNKRVDPWGDTRIKGGELNASIRYIKISLHFSFSLNFLILILYTMEKSFLEKGGHSFVELKILYRFTR